MINNELTEYNKKRDILLNKMTNLSWNDFYIELKKCYNLIPETILLNDISFQEKYRKHYKNDVDFINYKNSMIFVIDLKN